MASILIIDDNEVFCQMVQKVLGRQTHRVHCAGDTKSGLAELYDRQPDVVILDLMLHEEQSLEFLFALEQVGALRKVIGIFDSDSVCSHLNMDLATKMGAAHFLRKPIRRKHLLIKIDAILNREQRNVRSHQTMVQGTSPA